MSNLRLDSWKSIAGYLGRGIRTVQRWQVNYNMPVHHFGGVKGHVFAYSDDIDKWLLQESSAARAEETAIHSIPHVDKDRSHQLIANAESMWELRSERNLPAIVSLYREAVDVNPQNSTALIGLSRALIVSALMGIVDGFVAYPSATEALRRVSHDSPNSLDVLCTAAWLKAVYEHRWREARSAFDEVLSKKPDDSFALAGSALLYIADGELSNAFECACKAWTITPLATPLSFLPAWIQYLNQDYDDALELVANSKASGTHGSLHAVVEALVLTQLGTLPSNLDRIEAIARDFPQSQVLEGILGYAYASSGHPGKAWATLGSLMQSSRRTKRSSSYLFALMFMGMDEKQEALSALKQSFAECSLWSLGFHSDPILQPLQAERHFEVLLRKIGPSARGCDATVSFTSNVPTRLMPPETRRIAMESTPTPVHQ